MSVAMTGLMILAIDKRVMPVELKVLGWRKGERRGMVIQGAGGLGRRNGGGIMRTGGRVP